MIETGMIHGSNLRICCSTLNVCLNGMALATMERRDPGDFLRIAWAIEDGDPAEIEGVVIHANRQVEGTWLLGVRFVRVSDQARRAIFDHIRGQTLQRRPIALPRRRTPQLSLQQSQSMRDIGGYLATK